MRSLVLRICCAVRSSSPSQRTKLSLLLQAVRRRSHSLLARLIPNSVGHSHNRVGDLPGSLKGNKNVFAFLFRNGFGSERRSLRHPLAPWSQLAADRQAWEEIQARRSATQARIVLAAIIATPCAEKQLNLMASISRKKLARSKNRVARTNAP